MTEAERNEKHLFGVFDDIIELMATQGQKVVCGRLQDIRKLIKSKQEEIERLKKPADGTWIQKADAAGHEYSMCSVCETVISTPDGCGGYYKLDMTGAKYCPNCGARMD